MPHKNGAEIGVMLPQAVKPPGQEEGRRVKEVSFPYRFQREYHTADTLVLDL